MFNKIAVRSVLILGLMIVPGAGKALAQNAAQARAAEAQAKKAAESKAPAEAEAKMKAEAEAQHSEKSLSAYRLDFSLNEMDDGKKINTRQYSLNSRFNDWNQIKIGTRVPVEAKQGEFEYLDVGTSIRCRLVDQTDMAALGGGVSLNVQADISNFATPEQQGQRVQPVVRQLRIEASTVVALGKSMVVGIVDDPNSKRQFQLEVIVTKLK
jgi:hypothetical protein